MKIETKAEYYEKWHAGALGNKLRSWSSLAAIWESDYRGRVVMRVKQASGHGLVAYNLTLHEAEMLSSSWLDLRNIPLKLIQYNEAAPDEHLVMQGEVMRSVYHYDLYYSTEKTQMRTAMKKAVHMCGASAMLYLRSVMTEASYQQLQELFSEYPDSVVELSVYQSCLGSMPGYNTLIWECRDF